MQFYLKCVDDTNIVWDLIEYPLAGYTPIDLELPLPLGVLAGCFRYQEGKIVRDEELYEKMKDKFEPPTQTVEESAEE